MTPRTLSPLIGASIFFLFYLAASPIAGAFSVGELPLPGSSPVAVHDYLAANTTASLVTGILQGISGLGLAVVVAGPLPRVAGRNLRLIGLIVGWIAVAAILTSAALSIVLGLIADTAGTDVVATVRTFNFSAGGVVHVVALGVFVLAVIAWRGWSTPVRVVAWIAGGLAVLSVLSIFIFYASLFLPLGRLACMIALVIAGLSLVRRRALVPTS